MKTIAKEVHRLSLQVSGSDNFEYLCIDLSIS